MMDELVSEVSQKTGLSPEQARSAVESVLEFLKTRLPAPIADVLNNSVSSGTSAGEGGSGMLGAAASAIGSFLGKEK